MKNLHNSQDSNKIWSELDMMWCQSDTKAEMMKYWLALSKQS